MKHRRRVVVALACAFAVALGVVAPSVARATGEATPDVDPIKLYTISSCPECNGLPHEYGTGRTIDPAILFSQAGKKWEALESVESSDPSVATVYHDEGNGGALTVGTFGCQKEGTTYVTLTSTNDEEVTIEVDALNVYDHWDEYVDWLGEDEATARQNLDWTHYATLVVDDLLPFDETTIGTSWGETYVGCSYTSTDTNRELRIETSYSVSDPSILTVDEEGLITPLKAGTTDVTMTITDLAHPEKTFTDTAAYTVIDDGEPLPEPWGDDNTLLPYTIEDGVLTFDGRPDLGEWYQLDLDLGEGVTPLGIIAGGAPYTMTIPSSMLDADDPLYNADGSVDGPFFVRGDNRGAATNLLFEYPEGKALSRQLAGDGQVKVNGTGSLGIQLNGPATLKLSVASETVVTNEQGASIAHTPTDGEKGDDGLWSALTLVTEWQGGETAQTATDAVVSIVPGVTGHPYVYDIHLLDPMGNVFAVPDGDSVTVTLPIPQGLSADGLHVFHVADDGTVTDMNATVDAEAGTVSFTTTHFSTFVLANVEDAGPIGGPGAAEKPAGEKPAGEKPAGVKPADVATGDQLAATGDPTTFVGLLAAVPGCAALLGAAVLRKRR